MRYRILGKTGLAVSEVGFGAIPVIRLSQDEAVRVLRRPPLGPVQLLALLPRLVKGSKPDRKLGILREDQTWAVFV